MKWIQRIAAVVLTMGALLLAVGRAQAEPALWVVKGPHATVYLFGSVHVLKKDDPWLEGSAGPCWSGDVAFGEDRCGDQGEREFCGWS